MEFSFCTDTENILGIIIRKKTFKKNIISNDRSKILIKESILEY